LSCTALCDHDDDCRVIYETVVQQETVPGTKHWWCIVRGINRIDPGRCKLVIVQLVFPVYGCEHLPIVWQAALVAEAEPACIG